MDLLTLLENEPVEWKKLGDVVEVVTDYVAAGSFKTIADNVKYLTKGGYAQLVRTKDIKANFSNIGDFVYVDENAFKFLYRVNLDKECLILPNIGNCGEIYYIYPENLPHKNNVLGPNAIYLRSESQNNKYLYYFFHERYFQRALYKITSKVGQGKFNKTDLKGIKIPIPSLEAQEKIAKTLDKFTKYVTELQTELQKRIDQYTYYRDKLLSEEYIQKLCKEMEVDRRAQAFALSEIFEFKNGLNKGKEYFGKGIPFVSYKNVYKLDRLTAEDINDKVDVTEDEIERFSVQRGDVLFTRTSEVKEEVGYTSVMLDTMEQCVFNGFTIRGRLKNCDLLLPEFSAHLFRSYSVRKEIIKRSSFTTRASLSGQELGKVEVMIPPLSLQHKIVTILDKFQTMIADAKGLLPTEIEQRQQQYEYYREKLLTFSGECDSTHARTHVDYI